MAGKAGFVPIWMKHAEEQKNKEEQQNAATARAAFDATFRDFDAVAAADNGNSNSVRAIEGPKGGSGNVSDMESEEEDSEGEVAEKMIGPLDPSKCTAAGAGVSGGGAGAAVSLVITARDCDGRRVPTGGASVRVWISPSSSSSGGERQEAVVKDGHDGTYTATYAVARRGDYTVTVECDNRPILGSPFPVFFGGGAINGALPGTSFAQGSAAPSMNGGSSSIVSSMFPGLLGMIPGMLAGATGGVILPGMAASFGEICRDYLNGCCAKSDCKYNHPPQNQLMAALAGGTILGGLTLAPMAPSAAAMAAAQSIVAAQAYQANVSAQQHDKSGNAPPLPVMMQQAIASQQLQFQQSLFMQQAFISQQAAVRTATVKSATEMATARAAEISKKLKGNDGNDDNDGKETDTEIAAVAAAAEAAAAAASVSAAGTGAGTGSGSGSGRRQRLKSSPQLDRRAKSRSPIKYHRDRHSRSASRSPGRYRQGRHLRPIGRDSYRQRSPIRDIFTRRNSNFFVNRGRERERARGYHLQRSRRSRSRSRSRPRRKAPSVSPRHRRDRNRSPRSSRRDEKRSSQRHSRRSRSTSKEAKQSTVLVTDNVERTKSGKASKETHHHEDAKLVSDQGLDDDRLRSRKPQSNHRHGASKRSGEKERQSSEQIIAKARHSPESPDIVSSGVHSKDCHDGMESKRNEGEMQEEMLELDDW